jgi:multiple sugar transport system substrate-binding protein
MKKWGRRSLLLAMVSLVLALSACASKETPAASEVKPIPTEPFELSIYINGAMTDDGFKSLMADPIQKKYSNITVKMLKGNLEEMVTGGTIPDVVYLNPFANMQVVRNMNMMTDLNPLIKKFNVDLSRFEPDIIRQIQAIGTNGEMLAIPFSINTYAFYYNKDIFDKFGVEYPKNGMTWPQVIELARKVTRNDGGTQYRGLDINRIHNLASPYSLPLVDPKTNKAIVSDKWKDVFALAMQIYDIPGNKPAKSAQSQLVIGDPKSNLAMSPGYTESINRLLDAGKTSGLKWGVVQDPSFTDLPNVNRQLVVGSFLFAPGKRLETTFQAVVSALLSDEAQLENSKNLSVSPLKNPEFVKHFAENIPELKDVDLSGIFLGKYADPVPSTPYDSLVNDQILSAFDKVFKGTDINTALSAAKEAADAAIAAQVK